jgi:hypothetical protein
MGEFVDKDRLRVPFQHRVDIEFGKMRAVIFYFSSRYDFESAYLSVGLLASVGLDIADDDVLPIPQSAVGFVEHRICLAHSRSVAEKYFERSPVLSAASVERLLRSQSVAAHCAAPPVN